MKTNGTNYIASIAIEDLGTKQFTVMALPNGGEENGIKIASDPNTKIIYIVNCDVKTSSNTTSIIDGYTTYDGVSLVAFQKDTNVRSDGGTDPYIGGVGFCNNELIVCETTSLNNTIIHSILTSLPSVKLMENGADVTDAVALALDGKMDCLQYKEGSTAIGTWETTRSLLTGGGAYDPE